MSEGARTLVLVNGPESSVQGPRARALFASDARIVYKRSRFGSLPEIQRALGEHTGGWIYCIDLGFPASPLAAIRRRVGRGVRLAYEIGDPMKPLLTGRARAEIAIAHAFDRFLPQRADALVFRGSYLKKYFERLAPRGDLPRSTWLPDGVDTTKFRPLRDDSRVRALRQAHGLEGRFVVGIVGTIDHGGELNIFYGWELAEALALLPRDLPITGVVVGDGAGRAKLEQAKARLGLGERLKLVGRVAHEDVPLWMNVFDVGISTQTDDEVGWGRTTAKLPEYLACGLVVACTDVGEAHRLLHASGQTLSYKGRRDEAYPERLARHLERLVSSDLAEQQEENRRLAETTFDYRVLAERLRQFLDET
jgi:glycosyltransferase involved in cell wall biosynthesis